MAKSTKVPTSITIGARNSGRRYAVCGSLLHNESSSLLARIHPCVSAVLDKPPQQLQAKKFIQEDLVSWHMRMLPKGILMCSTPS